MTALTTATTLTRLEDLEAGDLFETSLTHRRGLVLKNRGVGVAVLIDCDMDDSTEVELHGQVLVEALG